MVVPLMWGMFQDFVGPTLEKMNKVLKEKIESKTSLLSKESLKLFSMKISTGILCFFTMVAFAANSVLCRMALKETSISPLEFTAVRLISGSLILLPIIIWKKGFKELDTLLSIKKAIPLFSYALFFSLAYIKMGAGVGALILFAAVQITMIGVSSFLGNRLNKIEWIGFFMAFGGLVYLLIPGVSAPPIVSALLMLLAGVSWGVYSLLGKGVSDPILATAKNFLFAAPLAVILFFFIKESFSFTGKGFLLAILSGTVTSGPGYVLWYLTLRKITTTIASIVQLSVPVIAAFGGVFFISEKISFRLLVSTFFIFGGIFMTIKGREKNK
jgi:drug/metabolite transporter (DMT)-like permease